jgi:hypothetical protein
MQAVPTSPLNNQLQDPLLTSGPKRDCIGRYRAESRERAKQTNATLEAEERADDASR